MTTTFDYRKSFSMFGLNKKMSTSVSIRKIKIPSLNSNALPRRRRAIEPTGIDARVDVLVDIAKMLVRKYQILPKWDHSKSNLLNELKTKSESKCMVELYRLCKKSLRKNLSEKQPKESKESKELTNTIFRELKKKKKKHSSKKKPMTQTKKKSEGEMQEKTITEVAQRSA